MLAYLATRGDVVAWRANTGAQTVRNADGSHRFLRFNFAGCPDILGYQRLWRAGYMARFLAVEVKAEGKVASASPEQRAFLARVRADGGIALVADDVVTVARALA